MKKIYILTLSCFLLVIATKVNAQNLFDQDFTSSNTVADYVNSTTAGANQFDYISSFGNQPASVSGGIFSFDKIGGSSAYIIRNTNISETANFLEFKMRVQFTPPTTLAGTFSGGAFLCIGDGTSDAWVKKDGSSTAIPTTSESFARFDFYYTVTAEKVTFRAGGSTTQFEGWNDLTIFCNKTGSTKTYLGPDGNSTTVNSGFSDLWIGTTKVRANAASTGTINLKKFKMVFPSQLQNMKTEIDYIKIWDETVLPVSLSSFTGTKSESGVRLDWKTTSEKNNSHFEILRSQEGQNFSSIATISGNGNSTSPIAYHYVDNNPLLGTNYYKLKQFDLNGESEEFAKVVAVKSGVGNVDLFTAFYNDGVLNLNYTSASAQKSMLVNVHDMNGKSILSKNIAISSTNSSYAIPVQLSNGMFVVSVIDGKDVVAAKIIN